MSKAYISCSWGVQHVGFVLICYGVADALGSITCGSIVKIVGRMPIFIFGALLNAGLIIALFLWQPDPSKPVIYFVIAFFWGLADSIWQTQINCKCFVSKYARYKFSPVFIPQLSTASSLLDQKKQHLATIDFGRVWASQSHSLTAMRCVLTLNFGYLLESS